MKSKISLKHDLKQVKALAFKRLEKVEALLTEIHRLLADEAQRKHHAWLLKLRAWLCTSYTLWPGDYKGLGEYALRLLDEIKELDEQTLYILENMPELPSPKVRRIVATKELLVAKGNYDPFLSKQGKAKSKTYQKEFLNDPRFDKDWAEFKRVFPEFNKPDKVMRRRPCMERNFRVPGFDFDYPKNPKHKAMLAFDFLCSKYCLFGVENDKGLLLKLSVNATPYGIMIFIPSYWSLDYRRDLNWDAINTLHKAWEMQRQSEIWNRSERAQQQRKAYRAKLRGVADGLRGKDLYEYIIDEAGLSKLTDDANVRKEVKAGEKLEKGLE